MRHGIPPAGNFLSQELAIATGAVEAMIVDVQCIMQALAEVASHYHTKLITTSPKAKIEGADPHRVRRASCLPERQGDRAGRHRQLPQPRDSEDPELTTDEALIAGFSHEYVRYMQGGLYRGSFRPLERRGRRRVASADWRPSSAATTRASPRMRPPSRSSASSSRTTCWWWSPDAPPPGPPSTGICSPEFMDHAGAGLTRGVRGYRHPAGGARGFLRGQLAHPHHPHRVRHRRRPGRGHLRPAGRGHLPGVHVGEGPLHRLLLRGVGSLRALRSAVAGRRTARRWWTSCSTAGCKRFGGGIEFEPDIDELIREGTRRTSTPSAKRSALPEYDPQRFGESGDRLMEEMLAGLEEGEPAQPLFGVPVGVAGQGGVRRCRDTSPRLPSAAPTSSSRRPSRCCETGHRRPGAGHAGGLHQHRLPPARHPGLHRDGGQHPGRACARPWPTPRAC